MEILSVKNLCKNYDKFQLKGVSFALDAGYIMGFIGANGAGKTTTLKCVLGLVRKDGGDVSMMGQDFAENELKLKQHIGFAFGGVDYYAKTKIRHITGVAKRFYDNWDDAVYGAYMRRFALDEDKRLSELSHGMRVKYSLVLALSHHARLLLLDEPTSGLDPVARDDLLELFQELIEGGERSILFSTHITSDLEKCADYITFIANGRIVESRAKDEILEAYRIVKGTPGQLEAVTGRLIAGKSHAYGFTGLIKTEDMRHEDGLAAEPPTLEDIMIYYARKEARNEESAV
jgi:ABC-2 type transport system ATP-binding protein